MEYLIFIIVIIAFFLAVTLLGIRQEMQYRRTFMRMMREQYGKLPAKKYTADSFRHIPTLFNRHRTKDALDDITWNDLDMDGVFARVNYCRSAAGEEVLYHMLRNPQSFGDGGTADAERFEEQVAFFGREETAREQAQLMFEQMKQSSKYSVYDYLDMMDTQTSRSNARHYLMLLLIAAAIVGCFVRFELFIAVLVTLLVLNLLSYYREKSRVEPYFAIFSHVLRILKGTKDLIALLEGSRFAGTFDNELQLLRESAGEMQSFRRGAFLVMSASQTGSGNPLELLFDYLRIFTHADLIKFNQMYRHLCAHAEDVDRLIRTTGALEVRLSTACLRASLQNAYCQPEFTEAHALTLTDAYHPLIRGAVTNSIRCDKNVLVTGSNASGKSTFLKMTAINAVLAQSLHTVFAAQYTAPVYRIFSSMALTDNLTEGDSYYIVEIKSLKRILDAAAAPGKRVLCFIDEVLRGTNTLERIAASAQILKRFASQNVQCFAATHDGELTAMLGELYDNYHFDGEISGGDVQFDYRLREGPATTRNAIQLLRMLGYDDTIVNEAEKTAAHFLQTGVWT